MLIIFVHCTFYRQTKRTLLKAAHSPLRIRNVFVSFQHLDIKDQQQQQQQR